VLSPDDRPGRVAEKLPFYLRASTPLVWVIDPAEQTVAVQRPGVASTIHRSGDTIDAAPVLSGFSLDIGALFAVIGSP
jgi:Uma2 family endonuclease